MVRTALFESENLGSNPYSPAKICGTCKLILPLSRFSLKNKNKLTYSSRCKDCQKKYHKVYYSNNKLKYIEKRKRQRNKTQTFILSYLKDKQCVDCGEKDIVVLEFDHLKDKSFSIGGTSGRSRSLDSIQREIDKCEIVCANCHKRRTAKRANWRRGR